MYVLNWEFSGKHPGISHPVVLACDQTQQIMSLLPKYRIPLAESFAVQANIHRTRDPLQEGHVRKENMLMPFPARPHLFPQRRYFCPNSHTL